MKILKPIVIMLLCMLMVSAFAACESCKKEENPEEVGEITLNMSTAKMDLYETLTLTATLKNLEDDEIIWTSSDTTKATVADGVVTSLADGEVTITATASGESANCVITIASNGQVPVLSVEREKLSLREGQTFNLVCALKYNDNPLQATFEYASDNVDFATVDSNGVITAVSKGKANITVTASYLGYSTNKTVTVSVTEDVLVEASEREIVLGTIAAEGYQTSADVSVTVVEKGVTLQNPTLTWESNDEKVATVDDNGKIISAGAGETIVSVTYATAKSTFTVNIKVSVEKPIIKAVLTKNIIDLDANDGTKAEVDLGGITANVTDLVGIKSTKTDADISFTITDGKVMINKDDVSVSNTTFQFEYTKMIYKADVVITNNYVNLFEFEKKTDADNIGLYWAHTFNLSIDNDTKYGTEKGTLKVEYANEHNFSYILLSSPIVTDISLYDYITFNVYNPTSKTFSIAPTWGTGTTIAANGWTTVKCSISEFAAGKITDLSSEPNILSASDITNLPFYISGDGWEEGECFYISYIAAGKTVETEKMSSNTITWFYEEANLERVQVNWSAEGNISLDTSVKYGEEKGSLKYTFTPTGATYNYLVITDPNLKDVSSYDYIEFNVYNPTDHAITIQPAWRNGTTIAAKGWTTVRLNISAFASNAITSLSNTVISATDITSLAFCIWNGEMTSGDSIYFSSFVAYNTESENLVQSFDNSADLSTVCSFAGKHTLSIDSTTVHGEDKGSLKVSFNNTDAAPGNTYVVLQAPIKSDVSEYDYISFWVYCDKACHIDILPATANVVEANTWTEIKITKDQLNTSQGFDGSWNSINISASDISQMSFYFTWCDDYRAGDSIYISSITCGKNA